MKKLLLIVLLLLPHLAIAADGEFKCNPAGTTLEMSICAQDDFKKADAKLNKLYAKLLVEAKQDDKDYPSMNDPFGGYENALRESQRAWVKFRDADCLRQTSSETGGTIRQIEYPACQAEMTNARIKELSTDSTK